MARWGAMGWYRLGRPQAHRTVEQPPARGERRGDGLRPVTAAFQ